jgi:hypothetical protein
MKDWFKTLITFLDRFEQQILAITTILAPIPATVLFTITRKGWIAAQQDISNNAQRPQITSLIVVVGFTDEQINNLGCHKFSASNLKIHRKTMHNFSNLIMTTKLVFEQQKRYVNMQSSAALFATVTNHTQHKEAIISMWRDEKRNFK